MNRSEIKDTPVTRSNIWNQAISILEAAIGAGAFPGAVFGVLHRGAVLHVQALGRLTYEPESPPVQRDTPFDLASISKVVATTALAMLQWQSGMLPLDAPVAAILPRFVRGDPWRSRITLRLLLCHSSGLPAIVRLYEQATSAAEAWDLMEALPLDAEPGTRAAYSDPGFILLGRALEQIGGGALHVLCRERILAPLEMESTGYLPDPALRSSIAPTEASQHTRRRRIQGEVHDENCFLLGGVSGHAGLFGPAEDLLRFAEAMLGPLHGRGERLFRAETVRLFTTRAELPAGSSRALGWDTPSGPRPSSGSRFHAGSFGHLGYTGTSLWIDPLQDVAIALLTNRTFPVRENTQIQQIRPDFHDAVAQGIRHSTLAQNRW